MSPFPPNAPHPHHPVQAHPEEHRYYLELLSPSTFYYFAALKWGISRKLDKSIFRLFQLCFHPEHSSVKIPFLAAESEMDSNPSTGTC